MPVDDKALTIPELAKAAYLNITQRRELEKSLSDTKAILNNPALLAQAADEEALQKQYDRESAMLESGSPPEYDTATRNKLLRLLKKIDADSISTMLSDSEMNRGRPSDIDRYFNWHYGSFSGDQKMLARRNILLMLDRDNDEPNFLSITRLREKVDESHQRNLPLYRQNFDEIKWEESVEDNLIADMDSQEWQTFLELKILDWTKPSICKELSWSTRQYEAALERLKQSRFKAQQEAEAKIDEELEEIEEEESTPLWAKTNKSLEDTVQPLGWPRDEMRRLGISQAVMAKAMNVSIITLTKWTSGKEPWPRAMRGRAANVLAKAGMSPSTFAEDVEKARDAKYEKSEPALATGPSKYFAEPSERFQEVAEESEED